MVFTSSSQFGLDKMGVGLANETVLLLSVVCGTRHGPPAMTEGPLLAKEMASPSLSQVHFRLGTKTVTEVRSNEGAPGSAPGKSLQGPGTTRTWYCGFQGEITSWKQLCRCPWSALYEVAHVAGTQGPLAASTISWTRGGALTGRGDQPSAWSTASSVWRASWPSRAKIVPMVSPVWDRSPILT
jgi:hypothetical protein